MHESKVVTYNQIKQIVSGVVYTYLNKIEYHYIKESWFSEYDERRKTFAISFTIQEARLNIRHEITFSIEDLQTAELKSVKYKIGKNGTTEVFDTRIIAGYYVLFPTEGRKTNIYPCFVPKHYREHYEYILSKQQKRKEKRQAGYLGLIDIMQETVLDAYKERGEV